MESTYLDVFRGQLGRECKFALLAVSGMQKALVEYIFLPKNNPQVRFEKILPTIDRFWYSVDTFLVAAGSISRLFWPHSQKNHPRRKQIETRCKELREMLGVADDSPLASRALQEYFERFDERIDKWFSSSKRRRVMDSDVFPIREIRGWTVSDMLRNFDPETWTLYFMDDKLELKPMIASITELQSRLEVPNPPSGYFHSRRRI